MSSGRPYQCPSAQNSLTDVPAKGDGQRSSSMSVARGHAVCPPHLIPEVERSAWLSERTRMVSRRRRQLLQGRVAPAIGGGSCYFRRQVVHDEDDGWREVELWRTRRA